MLNTVNSSTNTTITSIDDIINTLNNVKYDLERLGNELAASGGHKNPAETKQDELNHVCQIKKVVNLYKTLDEAINNLKVFVNNDKDSENFLKRIKREKSIETHKNINNLKSEANEILYSEDTSENDICYEIKDEHKTEINAENLEDNLNQELVKIEVDILPSKINKNLSKLKVKKRSKKLDIHVITKEIEHENIDVINFKCHECNFTGECLSDLTIHLGKIHPKIVYFCGKCDYMGATSLNVKDHYRSMHRGVLYPCQKCDYSSKRPGDLKNHLENVHAGPDHTYKCKHCDFSCRTKKYMRTHERFVHENLGHNCDLCSYSAKFPKHLKDHMDAVHSNSIYQCEECEYTCGSIKILTHHYTMKHKNKEELLCSKCPYKTYADRYLKSHMKVHLEDEKRLVYCTECSYSAKNSVTLRKHIAKKHSAEPPKLKEYFCELCEYMAHDKNTLNQHRAFKHEGIMHDCPVCGLKYSRASLVYRHMRRKHPGTPIPNSSEVGSLPQNALNTIEV